MIYNITVEELDFMLDEYYKLEGRIVKDDVK